MLSFEEGLAIIDAHAVRGTRTAVRPLAEAAGAVLAEEIRADADLPAFDRAAMDGFAFRHADTTGTETFRIAAAIAAGESADVPLAPGDCVKIMTGAPVPGDADTVIPIEDTSAWSPSAQPGPGHPAAQPFTPETRPGRTVSFRRLPSRGAHISPRGEHVRAGQTVLRPGDLLSAQELALIAAVGPPAVRVFSGPTIAFAATGDELIAAGEPPAPGKTRDSNSAALRCQILRAGATPHFLGIVRDREDELRAAIAAGLADDILILSGGISMGEYDLVPQMLAAAGVKIHFRKLRVRPGRPVLFGTRGRTLVFGLPGNPLSTLFGFELYVHPLARVFRHHPRPRTARYHGRLTAGVHTPADWLAFIAGIAEWSADGYAVTPLSSRGSADLLSARGANAILFVPVGTGELEAGATVAFQRLPETGGQPA